MNVADCYLPLDILFSQGSENNACHRTEEDCEYCCDGMCMADDSTFEECCY